MKTPHALLLVVGFLFGFPAVATDWSTCRKLGLTTIDDCMRYDDDPAFRAEVTRAQGLAQEKAKPAAPQTVIITGCDGGGCWDNQGNDYTRVGGNVFTGPNGRCRQIGNMLQCP